MNWNMIRSEYSQQMPAILAARALGKRRQTSPYFIDWVTMFTPIEAYGWQDIRGNGIPMYPQVPVGGVFIDFADPHYKIGVEMDGKDYHDPEKDRERDQRLWTMGWRIYRIPGRNSLPSKDPQPSRSEFTSKWEYHNKMLDWGRRWSEGFFWALRHFYYSYDVSEEVMAIAGAIIDYHHPYVDFEIEIEADEE